MQIEFPQPLEALVEAERHELVPRGWKRSPPFGQRAGIVLPETRSRDQRQTALLAEATQDAGVGSMPPGKT